MCSQVRNIEDIEGCSDVYLVRFNEWVIIDSGIGLLPDWRQTITWTYIGLLSNGPSWTQYQPRVKCIIQDIYSDSLI